MPKFKRVDDIIRAFKVKSKDSPLYVFLDIYDLDIDKIDIEGIIRLYAKGGVQYVIPSLSDKITPSIEVLDFIKRLYARLIPAAREYNIKIGLNLQKLIEKSYFLDTDNCDKEILSRVLTRLEYYYGSCEHIHKTFDMQKTMALTAYDELSDIRIDLTDKIIDGVLDYCFPEGNWIVYHYVCDRVDLEFNKTPDCASRLSREHYGRYIDAIVGILGKDIICELGKTISLLYVPALCFDAPNRRDWDLNINTEFEAKYGKSPSSYYDALYGGIGEATHKIKSALLSVRAELFCRGVIGAICDFADKHGIEHIYSLCEPKIPAGAWLFGDAIKNNSSCAMLDKAYMYGSNSIKLALPATENTDGKTVFCDIFGDYHKTSTKIIYNEAINSYAQGINRLIIHSPTFTEVSRDERETYKIRGNSPARSFSKFVRSTQSLLSLGKCVSDIAIMYPINAIQSNVNFYQRNETKFEYPPSQVQNDYMTLMSILSVNCAQDAMYVHPEDFTENCRVENKRLIFDKTGMECKILFLPGSNITSIDIAEKIKEFYDAGGIVVATVMLPKYAAYNDIIDDASGEYNFFGEYVNKKDTALLDIVTHIFGKDAVNPSVIRPYFKNTNENGGCAFFLPPSKTAADGSLHVEPALVKRIIEEADTPLDVYMSHLPKRMNSNGYNTTFPDFKSLGMHENFPYGGLINNIHKTVDGLDIFFFSNTSSEEYRGYAFIKGKIKPHIYNPYNKKRLFRDARYINFKGCVYTAIDIHLRSGESQFIIGKTKQESASPQNEYPTITHHEYNFLME